MDRKRNAVLLSSNLRAILSNRETHDGTDGSTKRERERERQQKIKKRKRGERERE